MHVILVNHCLEHGNENKEDDVLEKGNSMKSLKNSNPQNSRNSKEFQKRNSNISTTLDNRTRHHGKSGTFGFPENSNFHFKKLGL